jgi:hypothetical protein
MLAWIGTVRFMAHFYNHYTFKFAMSTLLDVDPSVIPLDVHNMESAGATTVTVISQLETWHHWHLMRETTSAKQGGCLNMLRTFEVFRDCSLKFPEHF